MLPRVQGPELHGLFMFDSHFGRLVLGQKLDIDLDIIDVALSRCIRLYSIVSRCIPLQRSAVRLLHDSTETQARGHSSNIQQLHLHCLHYEIHKNT